MHPHPRAILIAGPTASGKSRLALRLAQTLGGAIINADALQVYRELKILTARPDDGQCALAPHELFGHVSAQEIYSVARWLEAVRGAVARARADGRVPILVGGTGLYFRAALNGLAVLPEIPASSREQANALFDREGAEEFRAILARLDPESALRLPLGDRYRAVRAYEVVMATGRALSDWQKEAHRPLFALHEVFPLALMPQRAALNSAIEKRFGEMMALGAVEEARDLLALELPRINPAMKALGIAERGQYLAGEITLDGAAEAAVQRTRRYAKRQMTWIRGQMKDWRWIDGELLIRALSAPADEFLQLLVTAQQPANS